MPKFLSIIQQQIFPGFYTEYVNRKIISKNYDVQMNFEVDISEVKGKESEYIKQVEKDLESQLDRKKRIEDKAKSLLFMIAVTVTAVTFSLSYLKSLQIDKYQIIAISILFVSVIYFVFGAIRALQALNIRQFHVSQANVENGKKNYVLRKKEKDDDYLKNIIKNRQLNNLINIQLSNYTYASFNLIRNGIILFVLFFITTITFSSNLPITEKSKAVEINKTMSVEINDSVNIEVPYSFEFIYDVRKIEVDEK